MSSNCFEKKRRMLLYDGPKRSKQRDTGYIKRPMNAYIIWARKHRSVFATANPTASQGEVSEQLGIEWRKLSEEEKMPYFAEAHRLKMEHQKQFPDWEYNPRSRQRKQVSVVAAPEPTAPQSNLMFTGNLQNTAETASTDNSSIMGLDDNFFRTEQDISELYKYLFSEDTDGNTDALILPPVLDIHEFETEEADRLLIRIY
ncbi:transcription factor SOX-30-like [Clarias gariepinus]|uniref:transcription factor SOX-30-like n=1 Tax=Clarias gariepinus TaxID=13013 RepID=UPI00234C340B|nr:transcription factor SOX-30-like [Clarias gariepinus]